MAARSVAALSIHRACPLVRLTCLLVGAVTCSNMPLPASSALDAPKLRLRIVDGRKQGLGPFIRLRQVWSQEEDGEGASETTLVGVTFSGGLVFWDPSETDGIERHGGRWVVTTPTGKVQWTSPRHACASSAYVAANGYIWGVGDPNRATIPVFAHRIQSKAVLDWSRNPPGFVQTLLAKSLKTAGLGEPLGVLCEILGAGRDSVLITLDARASPRRASGYQWEERHVSVDLEVSADGTRLLRTRANRVVHGEGGVTIHRKLWIPCVDGNRWLAITEPKRDDGTWSTLDVQRMGSTKKLRLIDRSVRSGPAGLVDLSEISGAVRFQVDSLGNVYVVLTRHDRHPRPIRRLILHTKKWEDWGETRNQAALFVFDRAGRLIVHRNWTRLFGETYDAWVFPLADGSGYYRSEWVPGELRIYFHPLPK